MQIGQCTMQEEQSTHIGSHPGRADWADLNPHDTTPPRNRERFATENLTDQDFDDAAIVAAEQSMSVSEMLGRRLDDRRAHIADHDQVIEHDCP